MTDSLERDLTRYVEQRRSRLVEIVRDLVRIPSENTPPNGAEGDCQNYAAKLLGACGCDVELYEPDRVDGIREHPLFWPGRNYSGRPNLGARRRGTGGGKSLLLSGHMDTVPRGTQNWTRDPFGGEVENGRLYGRGSNDMKAGNAINLFVAESLAELGTRLHGDLLIEAVVDEEFGGVNGTLAGRLKGVNADAAVISEPTSLRVCPGQRGGRTAHLTLSAVNGGILSGEKIPDRAVRQLTALLDEVHQFAEQRRSNTRVLPLYANASDPVPVSVTKVSTGPWGMREPISVPEECRIEMYWQLMPGEEREAVDREFMGWLDGVVASRPELFHARPKVDFPLRYLPGSAIPDSDPLVVGLASAAACATGQTPAVAAIEGPCDMFVFHSSGIPAVLWGPSGGNTHGPDEYVDVESVVSAAKALLLFVCRWCGSQS